MSWIHTSASNTPFGGQIFLPPVSCVRDDDHRRCCCCITRGNAHTIRSNDQRNQVNAILRSFKRLKANAADGGKPYKEDTVEFKDTIDGLNIVVRLLRLSVWAANDFCFKDTYEKL